MYFDPPYYISVDLFILCLQICSLTGNGLIIYLFFSNSRLKNQQQLGLILTLAIADFLFAASTIPYIVNFIIGWNTVELLYPGHFTVFLAQPLVIHFKINLLIATGIAVDRLQAMRWPIYYRSKNHKNFIATIVSIGFVLALIDVYIEYSLGISEQVPGCNTIGCFVSHAFRLYWGMSNMVLNFLMLILALIVIYDFNKLLRMKKNVVVKVVPTTSTITNNGNGVAKREIIRTEEMKEKHNFNQTNRLSVCILIISIIFLLIPSIFVGAIDYFGMQTFERLGPFYLFGLLLAGVSNSCTYIIFHVEVKKAAFQLFGRIRKNDGNPPTRIISG